MRTTTSKTRSRNTTTRTTTARRRPASRGAQTTSTASRPSRGRAGSSTSARRTAWIATPGLSYTGARRRACRAVVRWAELFERNEGFIKSGLTSDRDYQAMVGRWLDHWDRHNWALLRQFGAQGGPNRPRPAGADGQTLALQARAYLLARRPLLDGLQRFLATLP